MVTQQVNEQEKRVKIVTFVRGERRLLAIMVLPEERYISKATGDFSDVEPGDTTLGLETLDDAINTAKKFGFDTERIVIELH